MSKQAGIPAPIHSVLHAVHILEFFTAHPQQALSLTEISRSLNIHKTTVYRTLRTLEGVGWVEQSADSGKYVLGSGPMLLASAARRPARELVEDEMRRLADQFNELVILAGVRGGSGMCIDLVKSKYSLSMMTAVGYEVPFTAGATGKALLAAQSPEFAARLLDTLPRERAAALKAQIASIQRAGFCRSVGEVDAGAMAVAVPLLLGDDRCALSISGPTDRMLALGEEALRGALMSVVRRMDQKQGLAPSP